MGDRRGAYRVFVVISDGTRQLRNLDVYVRVILTCNFKNWGGEA
jgi:hypothetical protein